MSKFLLSISIICASLYSGAQTATNFNANDCDGNNHDLFTELDAGKVIVICWVMPCSTCIGPAKSAHDIVQSYSVSNPGKVFFYMCDDIGTTSCNTLNNWASTNNITVYSAFSNSIINMNDYGSYGMPKTVVIGGGTNHTVFDDQINSLNASTFSTAVNNAIAASVTSVKENTKDIFNAGVSPNPAKNNFTLTYSSSQNQLLSIEICNLVGQKVKSLQHNSMAGKNEITIPAESLSNGVYFVKMNTGKNQEIIKLLIVK